MSETKIIIFQKTCECGNVCTMYGYADRNKAGQIKSVGNETENCSFCGQMSVRCDTCRKVMRGMNWTQWREDVFSYRILFPVTYYFVFINQGFYAKFPAYCWSEAWDAIVDSDRANVYSAIL
jgi:ribosomal protein L37AE/L43A